MVKRAAWAVLSALMLMPFAGFAQNAYEYNHAEIGVFGDFFRAQATSQNLFGVGGRVGVSLHPNLKFEADGAYDFVHNFSTSLGNVCGPGVTANCGTTRVGLRATHFSAGPKFQLGTRGPVRLFVFAKGGFVRFGNSNVPVTFGNFPTQLRNTDLNGVFYPGGGLEFFAGWFGFRGDVGDEIYFDRGANNNLRITFGPVIRF
jgi:hypothetical protein